MRSRVRESTDLRLEGAEFERAVVNEVAMAVDLPVSFRELKWQWLLIRNSVNALDSDVSGPTTGVKRRGLSGTSGRHAQSEQAGGSATTAAASA